MVHSQRPLQEKMALFWHNHFATAYSKVAGTFGAMQGTKMMALKEGELPGPQGQLETFRAHALGSFRDLLIEVAKDPAMLVWLDGRLNTRQRPQENFGREIMELFTFGIGNYTEEDVYAAARVFTGWNLRLVNRGADTDELLRVPVRPEQPRHRGEDVHVPDLRQRFEDDSRRARRPKACRTASTSSPRWPRTRKRPSGWRGSCGTSSSATRSDPDPDFVRGASSIYLANRHADRAGGALRAAVALVPEPWQLVLPLLVAGGVRRPRGEGGGLHRLLGGRHARAAGAMGQTLFEPPDVNGWELGKGWFSTGAMLARMNFAVHHRIQPAVQPGRRRRPPPRTRRRRSWSTSSIDCRRRRSTTSRSASCTATCERVAPGPDPRRSCRRRSAGLARLIVGSAEYQLM